MKVDKRRRIENKTDYRKRLNLLKGEKPRFVVRKTNKYLILQIIESHEASDKVLFSCNTKELLKHGWPEKNSGSLKSLPAAYLGGLLLGKKSKGLKENVILDMGLTPNTSGSRVYSAVKGLSDAGIKINFDEEVVPSKEKLEGENTKLEEGLFGKVKSKINGKE